MSHVAAMVLTPWRGRRPKLWKMPSNTSQLMSTPLARRMPASSVRPNETLAPKLLKSRRTAPQASETSVTTRSMACSTRNLRDCNALPTSCAGRICKSTELVCSAKSVSNTAASPVVSPLTCCSIEAWSPSRSTSDPSSSTSPPEAAMMSLIGTSLAVRRSFADASMLICDSTSIWLTTPTTPDSCSKGSARIFDKAATSPACKTT
mmetsp:Transcript_117165/g.294748  ORF Transcript_117165/g.294748 Transcript_117165/m.294748 type:complete len:206 (+) Transcript_117165:748-1365(+)